jgi:folate-binding protein YgfZ
MVTPEILDAARLGLAVGPVQRRGLLRATGQDARDYLHRMSTQVVNGLSAGQTSYAAFLTAKGHLLGEGHLLGLADGVLLDLDPLALAQTREPLEKFVIMDDVAFQDLSESHAVVPLLGPRAGAAAAALPGGAGLALQNGRRGAPGLDLVRPLAEAEGVRAALLASGAVALDEAALEALRIQGGLARFGHDMDATRLPMEAALTASAIAFDKGCYTGQEVVLRATQRGQIQRGLVQLALPAGVPPGARLLAAGVEVGLVTSAADLPEGRLGLGYLRRAHWVVGARLALAGAEGEAVVRRVLVEEAPAVKATV